MRVLQTAVYLAAEVGEDLGCREVLFRTVPSHQIRNASHALKGGVRPPPATGIYWQDMLIRETVYVPEWPFWGREETVR